MTRFTSSTQSDAVITADRSRVWALLSDPDTVARLTPFLQRIEVDGDLWIWHMGSIPGLPVKFAPTFTERMTFTPEERIDYEHAPRGGREPAAVKGRYTLEEHPEGTRLGIYLEICAALPLPKMANGMVTKVMGQVMAGMGDRFAKRMLAELDAQEVPA
jgi:carbon monoxide dehydrogenase subunit G